MFRLGFPVLEFFSFTIGSRLSKSSDDDYGYDYEYDIDNGMMMIIIMMATMTVTMMIDDNDDDDLGFEVLPSHRIFSICNLGHLPSSMPHHHHDDKYRI